MRGVEQEEIDFADLSMQGEAASSCTMPSGDYPSIDEVINKPIWVTGFSQLDTVAGDGRGLIKFRWERNSAETAFFTSSKKLMRVVTNAGARFPFHTIIKVTITRDMCGFEFRSAKETVTDEDRQNLEYYRIKKKSYLKQRR